MPNRLAAASSPYLLQHQDNPVDWYEWGEEAFAAARESNRPVLLSVGYSACHWCHVMAHESFEDEATAAYMNEFFVNVKVDREERPDVDRIYMEAVQATTGRGGWPMTVFLTPEGKPFFAGTYFPDEDRHGHPSFRRVMAAVVDAWDQRRDQLEDQAARLAAAIGRSIPPAPTLADAAVLARAYEALRATFDWERGGFGGAPKFPQAPALEFLLRLAVGADRIGIEAPDVVRFLTKTLDEMARGGIYDQLGGGFARYAVDAVWRVPHFEKMLYDNALLARVYLRGWQVTGREAFRTIAVETLDYLLRDMTHPDGGFFSAEDADSEGVEGEFYVFSWEELGDILGEDLPLVAAVFGASETGNFEGRNVLHRPVPLAAAAERHGTTPEQAAATVAAARAALLVHRERRVRPGLDDKVVTAWNGLALRAFAEAGAVLGDDRYLDAGRRNARFVLSRLRDRDGRLLRSWREGTATVAGFCEDYAAYALGLFSLYQATGETEWYDEASRLVAEMVTLFGDGDGGFFATGHDAEELIARPKNLMDNPTPADNTLAAEALLVLAAYTGDAAASRSAEGAIRAAGRLLERYPAAVGHMLGVLVSWVGGIKEVAVIGDPDAAATSRLLRVVWDEFRPDCVLAFDPGTGGEPAVPLVAGKRTEDGPLAYVCRDLACDAPTADPGTLGSLLDA